MQLYVVWCDSMLVVFFCLLFYFIIICTICVSTVYASCATAAVLVAILVLLHLINLIWFDYSLASRRLAMFSMRVMNGQHCHCRSSTRLALNAVIKPKQCIRKAYVCLTPCYCAPPRLQSVLGTITKNFVTKIYSSLNEKQTNSIGDYKHRHGEHVNNAMEIYADVA